MDKPRDADNRLRRSGKVEIMIPSRNLLLLLELRIDLPVGGCRNSLCFIRTVTDEAVLHLLDALRFYSSAFGIEFNSSLVSFPVL